MNDNDEIIKIILINTNIGVGITQLKNVFCGDKFIENSETTPKAYYFRGELNQKNNVYKYDLWDSARRQEKYMSIKKLYIKGS